LHEIDPEQVDDQDWVEDYLQITDVEPGRIWFEGGVGPISVPRKASGLARPGWSLFITAARSAGAWHTRGWFRLPLSCAAASWTTFSTAIAKHECGPDAPTLSRPFPMQNSESLELRRSRLLQSGDSAVQRRYHRRMLFR
jgi:hypothetical protein